MPTPAYKHEAGASLGLVSWQVLLFAEPGGFGEVFAIANQMGVAPG